jgi:Tol biopolymer transport system component
MGSVAGADLYLKAVYDDSDPVRLVDMEDNQYPYDWTAADQILFTSDVGASSNLMWVSPDSSSQVETYLDIDEDLGSVDIAPDGRYAAFASNETGDFEISVRSFPDPRQPVQVSRGGGDRPRWSPDGDAIYYWRAGGAAGDTLMRAEVETEPTFAVRQTTRVLVGDYALGTWDLHPDGDRIVIARIVEEENRGPPERFMVVVNWFSELRAALGEER